MTASSSAGPDDSAQAPHALRFPLLDLARFAAALLVVFFHWCFLFNIADPTVHYKPWLELEPYARYGYLGVNLFFLISGFLIVQSAYLKTAGRFLRARATRLYPAYLTCCALTYIVVSMSASRVVPVSSFGYNMTMLNGVIDSIRGIAPVYVDGVYWTLAVEWTFYGLMFLLVATGQLNHIERFLWLWTLACAAYAIHPARWLDTYLVATWGVYFIAGAAFFRACTAGWNTSRAGLAVAAFGLCLTQALRFATELSAVHGKPFHAPVVAGIITLFFAFFVALSLCKRFMQGHIPRWIAIFGALSYPIYLLHQQIGAIVMLRHWAADTRYVLLIVSMAVLIALAAAVHFGVERTIWAALRERRATASAAGAR